MPGRHDAPGTGRAAAEWRGGATKRILTNSAICADVGGQVPARRGLLLGTNRSARIWRLAIRVPERRGERGVMAGRTNIVLPGGRGVQKLAIVSRNGL